MRGRSPLRRALVLATAAWGVTLWLAPRLADAHWCNNIFTSPARLVVKPAQTTV